MIHLPRPITKSHIFLQKLLQSRHARAILKLYQSKINKTLAEYPIGFNNLLETALSGV